MGGDFVIVGLLGIGVDVEVIGEFVVGDLLVGG